MGIARGIAELVVESHLQRPMTDRLLQYGRQRIHFGVDAFARLLRHKGMRASNAAELDAIEDKKRRLTDLEFWGAFGFSSIDVLDVCDYEAATVMYDLNTDCLPEQHQGKYSAIFDGGTMEHVFHTPNFLKNTHDLLAVGGRVMHLNPASNSVDHGFFSFSPCFYFDYYTCNEFQIDCARLLDLGSRLFPIKVTGYDYPINRKTLDGYLCRNVHYNWFVITKTPESTAGRIPQQGAYEKIWKTASSGLEEVQISKRKGFGLGTRIRGFLARHPNLEWFAHYPFIRLLKQRKSRRDLRKVGKRYPG